MAVRCEMRKSMPGVEVGGMEERGPVYWENVPVAAGGGVML